jgi:DNA-binding transcriptional LysR family regulator
LYAGARHVSIDAVSATPVPQSLIQFLWFVRVVEAGSFSEAARRAGTSASAMSKALSRFERARGVRLLHRTTHSLSLTDEGDRLLEEGRALLRSVERAEQALADVTARPAGGRVRVTAMTSFARACLMPALPAFLRDHPDIAIEIQFTNEITDLAAAGIDIAIRSGDLSGLPGHACKKLFDFPWVACAAPSYLAGREPPRAPADLASHDLIGFRNKANGQILTWRFAAPDDGAIVRVSPRVKHIFDDADSAWAMVAAGFGVAWGPVWLGMDDLRRGDAVEVLRDWRCEETALWMVRPDSRRPPKRTQLVMDFLASLPEGWRV